MRYYSQKVWKTVVASAFSRYSFERSLQAGDSRRFNVKLKTEKEQVIEAALAQSNDLSFVEEYDETEVNGHRFVIYRDYTSVLLLRALAAHISFVKRIRASNRNSIVRSVGQLLSEGTPMKVCRRDIQKFYETLPILPIRRGLVNSVDLSPKARLILDRYLEIHGGLDRGIPRGTPLSPILAEFLLTDFDQNIRNNKKVYRYHRYVDDILAFTTDESLDFDELAQVNLPDFLRFNQLKRSDILIGFPGSRPVSRFEYLGYQFSTITAIPSKGEERDYSITIAPSKIKKIKSRIFLSLVAFKKDGNFTLLRDRILLLSGNYRVLRNRINRKAPRKTVRSGISFSYSNCKDGEHGELATNDARLRELDTFFQSLIRSKTSRFHAVIKSRLTASETTQLEKISFASGFSQKMIRRFSPDRINQIKKAWQYAE